MHLLLDKDQTRQSCAYKSIRIHRGRFADTTLVDSHTSKSISPTLKKEKNRSHKHSNRIAIGQRNILYLEYKQI